MKPESNRDPARHEQKAKAVAAEIAMRRAGIPTLETQKSDRLDFHEIAVWELEAMLIEAFERGAREAR